MKIYFTPIEFATPEYSETIVLRDLVLRKPLNLEFSPTQLAEEWRDIHFVCMDQCDHILACLVFSILNEQVVKMRQVAVRPELQGKGIGSLFISQSEVFALQNGFTKIELNARETAVHFYEKLGYEKVGKRFEEVTLPHFKMQKKIA